MSAGDQLSTWQRWLLRPQTVPLRRALFQVHLWSGLILGLYVLLMSVTGSVLVYANELYRTFTAAPIVSKGSGPRLTDPQLSQAVLRAYPGYEVVKISRAVDPDQSVDIWFRRGSDLKKRMFDVRTGNDVGPAVPFGIWAVAKTIELHDELLAGSTGRKINGLGALALIALACSGLVIWWPGKRTWKRSLTVERRLGWRLLTWRLHSAIGFWTFAFTIVFGVSGIYLSIPERVQDWADSLQPPTAANAGVRLVDRVIYWLAFLHFGRINGIGIPCHGPGVCDQATKFVWALFGLAPAVMFATGSIMWWNRVLRPRLVASRGGERAAAVTAS